MSAETPPEITFSNAETPTGDLQTTIRSRGCALTDAHLARAFQPLKPDDFTATDVRHDPVALKLGLVRQIMAIHNGRLDIEPRSDGEAHFILTFPAAIYWRD